MAASITEIKRYRQSPPGSGFDKPASKGRSLGADGSFEEVIGESHAFREVIDQIEVVAPTDSTVLIQGETGTGKELIARAIHVMSSRSEHALVRVNCGAIPAGLMESEMFGHEKGAFTGAVERRIGRFEAAHHGTIFLDEVEDTPPELQSKLLRVLQEQEFERLGSSHTMGVNVRVVAAANGDLAEMVAEKKFRNDLYYRLNVFPITLPPLRERVEDIPLLARHFMFGVAHRLNKEIKSISAETMKGLVQYRWPGNIRELQNLIERAVILTRGRTLEVPVSWLKSARVPAIQANSSTLETVEREHILHMLHATNWVIGGPNGAADRLGLKRTTLTHRMRKLSINRRVPKALIS